MKKNIYNASKKEATEFTKLSNKFEAIRLDVNNNTEYEFAGCGCCLSNKSSDIKIPYNYKGKGGDYWNQEAYGFLKQPYDIEKHAAVNPSLWTNGKNNQINGLFKVLDKKIYQVRGFDMANITFVRTKGIKGNSSSAGWLIFDTLMSKECTYEAMLVADMYFKLNLGDEYSLVNGVRGIIISHSHVDHFGGMNAVIYYNNGCKSIREEKNYKLEPSFEIYTPGGFVKHSVSENVYAGAAMARRAAYQYGNFIKPAEKDDESSKTKGSISIGIGQGQSLGTPSFYGKVIELADNKILDIDGLKVEVQLTPGTEAPAEMNNYIKEYKALWLAENCSGTLHNLYTLRGAQVRDGNEWAKYLMEAAELYGDEAQVIFQAHNWPHWTQKAIDENNIVVEIRNEDNTKKEVKIAATNIKEFIIDTAAIYKYINDQALLYMNEGYKMEEVAQKVTIPEKLARNWCLRPYYGTPYHDSKAVYQKYLGFYDANPVHLNPLSPEESAKKYIEYMGNVQGILDKAYEDYEKGNYRFVAEVTNLIVFSGNKQKVIVKGAGDEKVEMSAHDAAKYLCANALEQLGYKAESGIWRNAYLSAAYELRLGKGRISTKTTSDLTSNMDGSMLLDYIGILFDGEKGSNYKCSFVIAITEENKSEIFQIELRHGALLYYKNASVKADFSMKKSDLIDFIGKSINPAYDTLKADLEKSITANKGTVQVYADYMNTIFSNLTNLQIDRYKYFDIVLPHNYEVQIKVSEDKKDSNKAVYKNYNLRELVASCASSFQSYYDSMSNTKKEILVTLDDSDTNLWKDVEKDSVINHGYYNMLVLQTNVLEDGKFFNQIPVKDSTSNNDGIGPDGKFRKYEYAHILYECYKYLAEPYLNGADIVDKEVLIVKEAINLVEPYITLFRHRKDGVYNKEVISFEGSDMDAWKYIYPILQFIDIKDSQFFYVDKPADKEKQVMGVGGDGQFSGVEILHLAYQLYKCLYEKNHSSMVVDEKKKVKPC